MSAWHLDFLHDLRHSARALRGTPSFTFAAVLVLALGIGASTVIFSVFKSVLLQPLPFERPERLIKLWNQRPGVDDPLEIFSDGEYHELAERNRTLESLAAYFPNQNTNLSSSSRPITVSSAKVTADFFSTLGTTPLMGRNFLPEEDLPGTDDAVVLSYGLWQRRFGSDPEIIGRSIQVDGAPKRVVGVMPRGFSYPSAGTEIWLPLALERVNVNYNSRQYLYAVGRIKSSVSFEMVKDDIAGVAAQITAEKLTRYPGTEAYPVLLRDDLLQGAEKPLFLLAIIVAWVLLIACANVAGLFLARSTAVERDLAMRVALGASRSRVIRQVLTENLLLSLLAGGLGVLLAYLGLRALLILDPGGLPRLVESRIDGGVLAFALLVTLVASGLTGLAPALRSSRLNLSQSLKEGGGRAGGARSHLRAQNVLVVAEVALSFMLLIGAGLLGKSLLSLLRVDPGFRTENVLTFQAFLPPEKYQASTQVVDFFHEALEKIRSLPGVQDAGASTVAPLSGEESRGFAWIEGVEPSPDILPPLLDMRWIVPGYLQALGVPLVEGRLIDDQDEPLDPLVTVVSKSLADVLWPGESALGKRFKLSRRPTDSTPWRTVIGVVGDVRDASLDAAASRTAYFPHRQEPWSRNLYIAIQSANDPETLISLIRNTIQGIDADQPIFAVRTIADMMSISVAQQRFTASLVAIFAVLALTMASVGLYGVVSYGVGQRTREMGIRMALSSSPRSVLKMVLREGFTLALLGVGIGFVGALFLGRYIESLLFGVAPIDPSTFAQVAAVLIAAALLASYAPARHATNVDPIVALRSE